MFGVFWEGLLGIILIFSWGGLLALAAWLTPRFADYMEPGAAPTLFGQEERGAPATGPSPPPELRSGPPPPRAAIRVEEPADPHVAAAIAVALALHLGAAARPSPPPSRLSPGNPWPLAGRWQAMQTRLQMQKR